MSDSNTLLWKDSKKKVLWPHLKKKTNMFVRNFIVILGFKLFDVKESFGRSMEDIRGKVVKVSSCET